MRERGKDGSREASLMCHACSFCHWKYYKLPESAWFVFVRMCIHAYLCMYVCIYMYMCMYIYLYIYVYIHIYIYSYMYIYIYISKYKYIYIYGLHHQFKVLSEPSTLVDVQWIGLTPAAFQEEFRAAASCA